MLIGTINKGYEQIHIKENNGEFSFIKVSDKVSCLTKEEALNVLKDIFNTFNLKYLESNNEYDIYLDLANNKRYFKNGIEDFQMFYNNNGEPAVLYSNGIKEALQRIFYITTIIGTTIPLILTSDGINNFLVNYTNANASDNKVIVEQVDNSDLVSTITDEIPDYEYVNDIEQVKNYIMQSKGLSDFDKQNIYNEEYLKFLFSITDEQSKLYDFSEKMKDINVVTFKEESDETYERAEGYYMENTNTIHLLETLSDNLKDYASVENHEFIHLTQASLQYRYICEALAEMLSNEFYGTEIDSYIRPIENTKILIEVIGPDAVLNAAFNHDTTKFENAITEYLNEEDTEILFKLLNTTAMYGENANVIDDGIETLIKKMLAKKVNNDVDQIDLITEASKNKNKFYFNNNHENYYTKVSLDIYETIKIPDNINDLYNFLESKEKPNNVEINQIKFNKQQFLDNIKEIKNFLIEKNLGPIVANEKVEISKLDKYEEFDENNTKIGYSGPEIGCCDLLIDIDENHNFICNGVLVSDEELISNINAYNDLEFIIYNYISFDWDEFKNELPKFVYNKQYCANIHYLEQDYIYINYDKISNVIIDKIELPPISEEFDIEYLNKTKSK